MSCTDAFFVPTKSSNFNNSHSHEAVIFEDTKQIIPNAKKKVTKDSSSISQELTMKQVRFEVYKFAQSALTSTDKQKSKIELAIKLGAKPPKRKFVNYKELKESKKKEMEEAERKKEIHNTPNQHRISEHKSKLNKGVLRQKRKIGSGILKVYGTVSKKMLKRSQK